MNDWYKNLKKSSLTPPSYLFGIVWPILYTLMFISTVMVWNDKKCFPYCYPLTLFFIQLVFNLIWTTLFFKLRLLKVALINLGIIIFFTILTIRAYFKVNKLSAYLLLPYIIWLLFAFYLNLYITLNNSL